MEKFYFITTIVMFAVLGLCFGSFLNVLIYRLPRGMNLAKPNSHCPSCGKPIKWYDNIPLFSYIILGGKCRNCHEHISFRYFLVELTNAILWVLCAVFLYDKGIFYCAICALCLSVFLSIAFCDIENLFIPDTLQIALLVLGILTFFADKSVIWYNRLFGLLLGGGFFLFFYFFSLIVFKKEGLGLGDVKLMAGVGLFLGLSNTIVSIIISVLLAFCYVIAVKICSHFRKVDKKGNNGIEATENNANNLINEKGDDKSQNEPVSATTEQTSYVLANKINSEIPDVSDNKFNSEISHISQDEKQEEKEDWQVTKNKGEFAFGPFLVFGATIALFLGDLISNWYLSLFL